MGAVDFYLPEHDLAIECDGPSHYNDNQREESNRRFSISH
jgi:very-short-patch-repair endonuclease